MRLKRFLKKTVAVVTTAMLIAPSLPAAVTALAAQYYINFIGSSDKLMTTIVENSSINAQGVIPPGHMFDSEQPFLISDKSGIGREELFRIQANGSSYYTIISRGGIKADGSLDENADPRVSRTTAYTLIPKLMANINTGSGSVELHIPQREINNDDGSVTVIPETEKNYTMTVKSESEINILSSSFLTFSATKSETANGSPEFGTVTDADNAFVDYKGQQIYTSAYERTASGVKMSITVRDTKNNTSVFNITIPAKSDELIGAGSIFTINFDLQDVNSLGLTVVSPKKVVDDVGNGVMYNATDPNVTDSGRIPYIDIASGDQLYAIGSDFRLLQKVALYNDNINNPHVNIDWEWAPDDNDPDKDYSDVVQLSTSSLKTRSAKVVARQEDVKGKLIATPRYRLDKPFTYTDATGSHTISEVVGSPVSVNVTILGTGTSPSLVPGQATTYDGSKPVTRPITEIPAALDIYNKNTALPYEFNALLKYGEGRGRAEKMTITASGITQDAIDLYFDSSPVPYTMGSDITNKSEGAGQTQIRFVPKKAGQVTLTFTFWVYDYNGRLVESSDKIRQTFVIKDTTPLDYAEFSDIHIESPELAALGDIYEAINKEYPQGNISYGFNSDTYVYQTVEVPYKAENLRIEPKIPGNKGISPELRYDVSGLDYGANSGSLCLAGHAEHSALKDYFEVPLAVDAARSITLTVTAQNGREQIYIVNVVRMPASTDSSLKSLSVTDEKAVSLLNSFLPSQFLYEIRVPYATRWSQITAEANDVFATVSYEPALVSRPIGDGYFGSNWFMMKYPGDPKPGDFGNTATATTQLNVKVQAEDQRPAYLSTYAVRITRDDPSDNTAVASLVVNDAAGKPLVFNDGVVFNKDTKRYRMRIPYSCEKVELQVKPEDLVAQAVKLDLPDTTSTEKSYLNDNQPVSFDVPTPVAGSTQAIFTVRVYAQSEKGNYTPVPYEIEFTRSDPDTDNLLSSIKLTDQDDKTITNFSFNRQVNDYTVTVPFRVERVNIAPVPRSPLAKVTVNGKEITERDLSQPVALKVGETKTAIIEVRAEDISMEVNVYTITFTREQPSTDARLKSLEVGGGDGFSPKFVSDRTNYTVDIPEGTQSITFTAVPVVENSTMMINGEAAQSGQATTAYEPLEAVTKVNIIVTAEDGKTTKTYVVTVTNRNLIAKSSDAELKSLVVEYASLSPKFKPSITEYDVAVKDDSNSVDIYPEPRDDNATVKVFAETRELIDYYGSYSSIIREGATDFRVEVTAEDGETKRTYQFTVYRGDEENQGTFRPITNDMVDFEQSGNTITIDITKYTVVSAEVFNNLRDNYPEKTIIFEGNDYTLQIKGSDISKIVPHEAVYDLSVAFSSPEEDNIIDLIEYSSSNQYVDPVYIYFGHHGALPGPMLFTISLGRRYRNESATWNYYNTERDRIDFYGGIRTNSRGTFTVPLTHFSTYIYSEYPIRNAENKSGEAGQVGSYTGYGGKTNPNTGR